MINDFLKYLKLRGVSSASLKYYKSDISNFLNWAEGKSINVGLVNKYIKASSLTSPRSTINRRLSTLRSYSQFLGKNFMLGVTNVTNIKTVQAAKIKIPKTSRYRFWQEKILNKLGNKPKIQNTFFKLFFSRPNWYKIYHSYPLATYIHVAILILFTSTLGFAVYDQIFKSTDKLLAFPTALTRPSRYLSFQGRLTSNVGNPITTATNVVFKLYDADTAGTELWTSGTCSITPDQDGIFSILLGTDTHCPSATEIAATVFSENASVWVGVTVAADSEATPRIQIATVAYALNSETLQGYPAGTGVSTIPYIDSTGTVILASASPKLQSTSGTFAVEGQTLTITTPNTSNGVITINPDGTGTLDLTFEGAAAGLSANGFINATNANITSGALYGGTVASAATGYNFIDFQGGVSPASKFSVSAVGNTTMAGDLIITGDDLFMNTNTANYFLMADGTNYNPTSPADARTGLGLTAGGDGDIWVEKAGDTMTGALVNTLATGNSLVWDTNTLVVDATNHRVGIGTTTPTTGLLDVRGIIKTTSSFFAETGGSDQGSSGSLWTDGGPNYATTLAGYNLAFNTGDNDARTTKMYIDTTGLVGIGTTTPASKLDIKHSSASSDVLTVGINDTTDLKRVILGTESWHGALKIYDDSNNLTVKLLGGGDNYLNSGSVGVGDATPDHKLDVAGNVGLDASGYINWGDTDGTTGYGFRDNAGTIEFKNSAGSWAGIGSGGGGAAWSDLTDPVANLTLAMGGYTTTFNWDSLTTGTGLTGASTSLSSGTLASLSVNSTAAASNTQTVLSLATSGANGTSTQKTYGLYATNTHTGTASTNIGGYFSASGGTNNYGLIVNSGNVGIGTTGPDAKLDSLSTTEQLRLTYTDGSIYSSHTVDASGNLTIDNTGTKTIIADDLQITGDNLFMNTNTAGMLLVADGTNYNPTAVTGDITINGSGVTAIGANKITESMLKSVNSATDEYCLTYEATVGDFEWQTCGSSSIAWSSLTNPAANLTLAMGGYTTTFNWDSLTTGTGLTGASTSLSSGTLASLSVNSTAAASNTQKVLSLSTAGANGTSTQKTYGLYATNTHTGTASTNVGGYFSASGGTYNHGLIVENGQVGIGTTTPGIVGATNYSNFKLDITGGDLLLSNGKTVYFRNAANTSIIKAITIDAGDGLSVGSFNNLTSIYWVLNGATRMTMLNTGNLGLGTASPGTHRLSVVGTAGLSTGTAWTNTSDARLKNIESNLNGSSLEKILALNPVSFRWNDLHNQKFGSTGEKLNYGFIAQEVEKILPSMISTDEEGYKWYNPSGFEALLTAAIQEINAKVTDIGQILTSKIIKTEIISPIANTDLIIDLQPDDSQSASKLVIKGENNQEVASIDAGGQITANSLDINNDATISGTLYADSIESERLNAIEELLHDVETNQTLLTEAASWNTNTATNSGELIANSLQTTDLFVTGQAAMTSLFITNNLTVKSIDSLTDPLQIQSLAASSLEIMAGRIIIDTDGNTKFLGDVEIAGNLKINNIIVANNIYPETTISGNIAEGEINTNAIAGKTTLTANTEKVRINNPKVNDDTLIYITPLTSTQNKVLYVKEKGDGYFDVGFSENLDSNVEFNWWIIDLQSNQANN